jgi:hypothetical protein
MQGKLVICINIYVMKIYKLINKLIKIGIIIV